MSNSRKYERYFKPISKSQFSTAGTIRAQGRVGQTSLSRSLVNTPFRGVEPRGTGGCCGTYNKNIVNSCCATTPSNGQTSINSVGLRLSRVRHPTSVFNNSCQNSCKTDALNKGKIPNPPSTKQFGSVKDFSPLNHSQSSLINKKNAKIMQSEWNSINGKFGKTKGNIAKVPHVATSSSQYLKTQFLYNNPTQNCC
ncbi:hypothetical protein N9O88_01455 [bacterium]|nr:hypothetical protein [bacterium]